jgi:DNA-directed RNA polymerase II subunit RPB1
MARAFAEKVVRQKAEVEKEESTVMARANTSHNAVQRERLMEFQREELINVVPQLYPVSYALTTMSTEDMRAASVATITNASAPTAGCANIGTVDDPRMGPTSPGVRCATCSRTRDYCVGHPGFIPFSVPILSPHPDGVRTIVRVLNLVCGSCGKLKLSREELESKGILKVFGPNRLKRLEKYAKGRTCRRMLSETQPPNVVDCSNRTFLTKPKTDKEGLDDIFSQTSKSDYTVLVKPQEVYEILDSISDEDAELLGFGPGSHPRNLVLWGLTVIPPASRPPNVSERRTMEHDLTRMYRSILKDLAHIDQLSQDQLTDTIEFNSAVHRLRTDVKVLIGVVDQSGGRKKGTRSIKSLVSSKTGLVVRHLQGKRVEGSGRAVMSLDPRLKIGQIGIPRRIARALTVQEVVTPSNIDTFTEMLKNNEIIRIYKQVPGRSSLLRWDVDEEVIKRAVLNVGDKVERMSRNGDIVFINRNPTLSRQSIIAGEVVITDDRLTIDTHLSYMSGLAGDYDGDEVNVHGPSTPIAREEARELMHVKQMLISTQTNRPNLSLVFDAITACSIMTQTDTFLDHTDFMRLLALIDPAVDLDSYYRRLRRHYVPIDSGKALFSALLPEGLFYQIAEPALNIQDGILISGSVQNFHVGSGSYTITQAIFKDLGRDPAIAWLDNAYRVGSAFLDIRGFTIGPADFQPDDPEGVKESTEREYQTAVLNIERMSKPRTPEEAQKQERSIAVSLNRVAQLGTQVLKNAIFDQNNNLSILFRAGYPKVTGMTIARVQAFVGQVYTMASERPAAKLSEGQRCLPMFDPGDTDPAAHGFCKKGYTKGMGVADMMFAAMTDREAITVKYVHSSASGWLSKQLAKGLEDVMVWKDGSVVAAGGWIIQPLYGYDGFDTAYLEQVRTRVGTFPFFTNIERLAGMINNSRGYVKTGSTWGVARR